MKKIDLLLSVILLPIDYCLLVLAGWSAYYMRFAPIMSDWLPVTYRLSYPIYMQTVFIAATLWLLVCVLAGLYSFKRDARLAVEFRRVVSATAFGFVLIMLYVLFVREIFSSRFIVLAAWLFSIIYLFVARIILATIRYMLHSGGIGVKQIIVIGDSKSAESLIHEFSSKKHLGYSVVKRFDAFGSEEIEELLKIMSYAELDEIIQADPNLSKAEVLKAYDFADEHQLTFKYAADLLDTKVLRVEVSELAGIPIVEVKATPLDGWGRVMKRIMDIIGSSFLIAVTSPVMLVTAIAIKLDSRGTVFFSKLPGGILATRIGQGGKPFHYFKFRSMVPDKHSLRYTELADKNMRSDGPMVKIKDDPRVTRVGKFIRRFSIDELPELFLVFIGRMSLVGPRPHLPEEVAKYKSYHKKVLTIKPGITGLAQVSGRSDLSFEDEVKLDTYYIENWSLGKDFVILLQTPLAVFRSRTVE
ncbi:hypothetical protein COT94_02380 [Candidatus Falkowbacteria bacterium CG10_big_fil_rev_8_21_14_0_10_37_14]|uniref:Bacterial sugar transferase domain-containing protein n=1 Tax=Candidatus Falkowbacteria bacterium CG10_big_fil_rev_8_21_14_0_10_37_14 TaxID=1974561 RepID=A0A2M6WTP9_9BACT|nr:sugar transferase [Candidatus Falkowbacteria bacterium]PIT96086.1 MAG: hypothetical protein COT94_02380 [Candidatus Falkowbacteria bacterium CG10_big_fil_rev_8_21_14_0_10_37_14]